MRGARPNLKARLAAAGIVCGTVAGGLSWYGCSVYDSSLLVPGPGTDGSVGVDAPHDGGTDGRSPEAAPPACPGTYPPPPPPADDPSDGGDFPFVTALHSLDLGLGDAGPYLLGLDLDNVSTCCEGGAPSCLDTTQGKAAGNKQCDNPGGRDNAGGQLLGTLASIDPTFNVNSIDQRLQHGQASILVAIHQYNGTKNDTQVTAAVYASAGVVADAGALWDGTDQWTIDPGFVVDPDASLQIPNHFDKNAYVADGKLVVHVDFPLTLGASSQSTFEITLSGGILMGDLVPATGGTFSVRNGTIGGRWEIAQMLSSLQTLKISGQTLCPGSNFYKFLKGQICAAADILSDPTKDNSGVTCDAISLGLGFTSDPAQLGPIGNPVASPALCPASDAGPDDCTKP